MKDEAMTVFADGSVVSAAVQSLLRTADALFDNGSWEMIGRNMMSGIAEGILSGAGFVNRAMETVGAGAERIRRTENGASGYGSRSITQNIYLRDNDASPYKTARRIRRESEAMFRN